MSALEIARLIDSAADAYRTGNFVWLPDVDILIVARSATVLGIVLLNIGLICYAT